MAAMTTQTRCTLGSRHRVKLKKVNILRGLDQSLSAIDSAEEQGMNNHTPHKQKKRIQYCSCMMIPFQIVYLC